MLADLLIFPAIVAALIFIFSWNVRVLLERPCRTQGWRCSVYA